MENLVSLLDNCINDKGKNPNVSAKNLTDLRIALSKDSRFVLSDDSFTYNEITFNISESTDQKEDFIIHYN